MICEHCRKKIGGKGVKLVNFAQFPPMHLFCSKKCKDDWCCNARNIKSGGVMTWTIGVYLSKWFFIKKILNIKGPNRQISYFSKDLNSSKNLELIRKGVLKVFKALMVKQ
ncbi:MAG: hypothetical protein ACFFAN_04270 [Promethearchaeota archaeon]